MNLLCFSTKAYSLKLYLICFYINFKSLKLYLILNWCYTKLWIRIWNQKFDSVRCKYKHYYISIKLIVFKESNFLKKRLLLYLLAFQIEKSLNYNIYRTFIRKISDKKSESDKFEQNFKIWNCNWNCFNFLVNSEFKSDFFCDIFSIL